MKSTSKWWPTLRSPLWFLPPAALGVFLFVDAVRSAEPLEPEPVPESARVLSVVGLDHETLTPRVTGFGTVRPARVWSAVTRVAGAVVETDPRLDSGSVVEADALLVRIEATDYEIAVASARAEIAALEAELAELEQSLVTDRTLLEVERASVEAAQRDADRNRALVPEGTVSASTADAADRTLLAGRASLTNVQARIDLFPSRRDALEASLSSARARLRQAELDVDRTSVRAPFRGRLVDVDTEAGQFVSANQSLFSLHAVDACEIDVQLLPEDLARLGGVEAVEGAAAQVRVPTASVERAFEGVAVRVREQVDARSRTLSVVVRVEAAGEQPLDTALLAGSFCEVELIGRPLERRLRIPRSAVRLGQVFVVDADSRARRRAVRIERRVGDELWIADGLAAGDRIAAIYPVGLAEGALVEPAGEPE